MSSRLKTNLWVAYLGALVSWSILAYSMIGDELNQGRLFAFEKNGRPFISDFVNIYNAAVLSKRCATEKINIYSPEVQAESAAKLTYPVKAEQPFYLQTPPYFFTLVRPLAELSILQAWVVWSLGSIIVLLLAVKLLVFESIPGKFSRAVAIIAPFASFPEWEGLRSGNSSLWLAPGIVLMWYWILRRPVASALSAFVALIKIQYLPIAGLSGWILGGKKFFITMILSAVALMLLGVAGVGLDNVLAFPSALLNGERSSQVSGVAPEDMQNLRGELVLLTNSDGTLVHLVTIAVLAAALVAVGFLWWRRSRTCTDGSDFKIRASITTILLLITSPHTHKHDFVIAVVPAVFLWSVCSAKPEIPKRLRLGIESAVISFPMLSWPFFILLPLFHLVFIQPYFFWAVALCLFAFSLLRWNEADLNKSPAA